ncbi:MAG: methylmalonyl-CoA mutase family protein, partial [Elusimicrobia bacterium]|nr:methylmalonyl-CoA mutase family protein [Elusimicrobiota bacterium]
MSETKPFTTSSGIELQRTYGPLAADAARIDTADKKYEETHLGSAGSAPYTRGIQKTMYRGRLWTMRQYAGFGTAAETNERFRFLLAQGQTGLSTAFDLPTQMGLDADHPRAQGEVGRLGVHIGPIEDMEELFDGIPQGDVSTSLTINATAPVLMALYAAVAKKRGVAESGLRGTVQNDILKEYIARGTYIFPPEASLRLCADTIEYAVRHMPQWHPISISGYHIREAGANAVQELAFTFGNAEVYVQSLLERGLGVDEFGPRLAFFFGCHNHFLEEIAKFRAARRIWSRLMREEYGAKDPKTLSLKFHVQTCGSTLTSRQPVNNVMRVALQAMAAVLGGAQSLHTNAYDEALALPSEEAAQLALRTQQILAYETGITDCVDPVAGSYAVESLTDEIERRAQVYIAKIDELGGMLPAIELGYPQAEIAQASYDYQRLIESKRLLIAGVNAFTVENEHPPELLQISGEATERQCTKLASLRQRRDSAAVERTLERLREACRGTENTMPHILA